MLPFAYSKRNKVYTHICLHMYKMSLKRYICTQNCLPKEMIIWC